ncbi:MAG TPA: energy transducer TonB [Pyrinomonadaceae bacterium]|jgi:protein TonB
MFTHLIESGSHKKDVGRRGRFFLGTLACYGLLLLVAGVASVYAYDSRLGKQNLELYTLVAIPLPPTEARSTPDRPRPAAGGGGQRAEVAQRVAAIAPLLDNTRPPATVSTESNRFAELPRNAAYVPGDRDVTPTEGVGVAVPEAGDYQTDYLNHRKRPVVVVPVDDDEDPRPVKPTPTPAKPRDQIRVSSSVISSKIISKPTPAYPPLARQARVQGTVTVEILIDVEGRVVSAQATNGHPLLRLAAQQSAYHARFSPTSISGQPVKVSGVITYNFILQ